jgi:hypothetical protein
VSDFFGVRYLVHERYFVHSSKGINKISEVNMLQSHFGTPFWVVTPSIRGSWLFLSGEAWGNYSLAIQTRRRTDLVNICIPIAKPNCLTYSGHQFHIHFATSSQNYWLVLSIDRFISPRQVSVDWMSTYKFEKVSSTDFFLWMLFMEGESEMGEWGGYIGSHKVEFSVDQ